MDSALVAWHEVPGIAPPQRNRPVGHGVIRAGVRANFDDLRRSFLKTSRRTYRLEPFLGMLRPDHTVPDATVPSRDPSPGTSCQATIGVVPTGRAFRRFSILDLSSVLSLSTLSREPQQQMIQSLVLGHPFLVISMPGAFSGCGV